MNTPRMQEAWDKSSRTADGFYSSKTPTSKCAINCYDEGCKLERELAHAIRERDEWKAKFIQQNKDLGCEQMDPNGTIWDYAKKLQDQCDDYKKQAVSGYELRTDLEFWLQMSAQEMRLRCGELSPQEIRSIRAVLNAILPPNTKTQAPL